MTDKSPMRVSDRDRVEPRLLASSFDRAEADRARAILLTLEGWTSGEIGQAFGVREDTVRLGRSDYAKAGLPALETHVAAGPSPVKAQAALRRIGTASR